MRYLMYEGVQLYIPSSVEEERLVFDRLRELLVMQCGELFLWAPKNDQSAWFQASCLFPFTRLLESTARHVESFSNASRPHDPYVFTLDVALPTSYEVSGLECRWSPQMRHADDMELFTTLARKVLKHYKFSESELLATLKKLYRDGFTSLSVKQEEV